MNAKQSAKVEEMKSQGCELVQADDVVLVYNPKQGATWRISESGKVCFW